MSSFPRSTRVRVPGKALLFGEYGLLAGSGGPGIVLTLPQTSFLVRVEVVSVSLHAVPFLEVKSAFLGPEGLCASLERWQTWCDEGARTQGGFSSHERYFFSVLFPFRDALAHAGLAVRVAVLEAFSPSLGLGSSSALLVGVHEGLRRLVPLGPHDAFEAALKSIHLYQGRGSGYDAQVQRAALGTLTPKVFVVVPGEQCTDVSDVAFSSWQRDFAAGCPGFSLHASGTYAPTAELLATPEPVSKSSGMPHTSYASAHTALAEEWRAGDFSLRRLPELCARSREIALHQGLFGNPNGPFALTCSTLQSQGVAFKTTGAGHGDALLCVDSVPGKSKFPETSPDSLPNTPQSRLLGSPFFRLEDHMSKRLPLSLVRLQEKLLAARERGELLIQAGDRAYASAPSNIALVKYWGKKPGALQVPVNASLSFSLAGFRTFTCVEARASLDPLDSLPAAVGPSFPKAVPAHRIAFSEALFARPHPADEGAFEPPDAKVSRFLGRVLEGVAPDLSLSLVTVNTFPTACGIASSASGFAALTAALGELLDVERHLGAEGAQHWRVEWARIGSGSATRSCFEEREARFVAWEPQGTNTEVACLTRGLPSCEGMDALHHGVVVFDAARKAVSSSEGHEGAATSPLQALRVAGIPRAFAAAVQALASNDFETLGRVAEEDAFAMHAVMQTAQPPACYFRPSTETFLSAFVAWRDSRNLPIFWTLDAGPNVHLLYRAQARDLVIDFVRQFAADEPDLRAYLENGKAAPAGLVLGARAVRSLFEAREKLLVRHEFSSEAKEAYNTHNPIGSGSGSVHA
ncbi:MAG: hypothetical protein IOD12_02290 [Silvanigrellales bacterium]|nr:hypothetical protein [Silvanigrellales bacterium]